MIDRREDDQVDPITGIPVSAAHEAIYTHIEESCEKIIVHQEELHKAHLVERHHPSLNKIAAELGQTPTQLMAGFIRSIQTSVRVVEALDGPLVTDLDGKEQRRPEEGLIFKVEDIQTQLSNGIKHKAELSRAQWVFAGIATTALASIAVALIGSLL